MYHIVYKTTHKESGMYYVGVHSTDDLDDGYMGSGRLLKLAIEQHGRDAFERVILHFCESKSDAFQKEREIVNRAFVQNEQTYNLCEGGSGHKGADRRSRNIQVYDKQFTLVETFPTMVDAGRFLDTYPTTVREACEYAAEGKSSRVQQWYVCYEGDVPIKKDTTYLTERNKLLAKYNTGKRRPEHGAIVRAHNLTRPEANVVYQFIHEDGMEFEGTRTQLRDAFPQHNLLASELANLSSGRSKSHRGWRLRQVPGALPNTSK